MRSDNSYPLYWKAIHGILIAGLFTFAMFIPYLLFGVVPFYTSYEDESEAEVTVSSYDVLPSDFYLTWSSLEEEEQASKDFQWCRNCHSLGEGERHRTGPNIYQILGRRVGVRAKFYYSDVFVSMRKDKRIWTIDNLDAFIKAPKEFAPGTRMRYPPAVAKNMLDEEARQRALKFMLIKTQ